MICTSIGNPDDASHIPRVEADEDAPIYCEECELWTNGPEQWKTHVKGSLHKTGIWTRPPVTSENNDVETGDTSRASDDADAAGNIDPGETNDGDARFNLDFSATPSP